MSEMTIRAAVAADAQGIAKMLSRLADDLGDGDVFASTGEIIRRNGFGPTPMFHVVLAEIGDRAVGFALYFPHFSTTLGRAGVYVQDLWVDPAARGNKVGQKLLAVVAKNAANRWGAEYMKLSVHTDNPRATHFYSRLGFSTTTNETPMILEPDAFKTLEGAAP